MQQGGKYFATIHWDWKNNIFFLISINTKSVFNRDTLSQYLQKKAIEVWFNWHPEERVNTSHFVLFRPCVVHFSGSEWCSAMPRPDCLKHQDHLVSQYTNNEYDNMKKINSKGHSKNIAAKLS